MAGDRLSRYGDLVPPELLQRPDDPSDRRDRVEHRQQAETAGRDRIERVCHEAFRAMPEVRREGQSAPQDSQSLRPLHEPFAPGDAQDLRAGSCVADGERHHQDSERDEHDRRPRVVDNAPAEDQTVANSVDRRIQKSATGRRHLPCARKMAVDDVEASPDNDERRSEREMAGPYGGGAGRGDHQGQQGHVVGCESATGRQAKDRPHEPIVEADEQRPQKPMTSAGGPRRWQLDRASRDEEEVDCERDREKSDETKEVGQVTGRRERPHLVVLWASGRANDIAGTTERDNACHSRRARAVRTIAT